jgi:hypothetical protein
VRADLPRARRVRRLLAGVLVALAGCRDPASPTTTSSPATGAPDAQPAAHAGARVEPDAVPGATVTDATDLLAFLQAVYGRGARLQGEWADPDGRRRHVCAQGGPRDRDPWPSLLAVCADVPDCMGDGSGAIDFFALVDTDAGVRADAQAREVESGANGCAGDVSVVRFGRERWGFLNSGGLTSQGYLIGWTTLSTFRAGRLEELATVNTTFDNNGAKCDADDCREVGISINSDLRFDATDPQADAWPLVVHQSGVECFLNFDRSRRYSFDAARFRYPVPEGPPDETCPPAASH